MAPIPVDVVFSQGGRNYTNNFSLVLLQLCEVLVRMSVVCDNIVQTSSCMRDGVPEVELKRRAVDERRGKVPGTQYEASEAGRCVISAETKKRHVD